MKVAIDIYLTKEQLTTYLSEQLNWDSAYDELRKREELITMLCLQDSCTLENELKEMFKRILTKFKNEKS
jgi:hypothetical protein